VKRDKMLFDVFSLEMDWVELALSNPIGREIGQSLLSRIQIGDGRATQKGSCNLEHDHTLGKRGEAWRFYRGVFVERGLGFRSRATIDGCRQHRVRGGLCPEVEGRTDMRALHVSERREGEHTASGWRKTGPWAVAGSGRNVAPRPFVFFFVSFFFFFSFPFL
jgi:hypothetical protein